MGHRLGGKAGILSRPLTAFTGFQLLHLVVEAVAGVLVVAGAVLVTAVGRHRLGWTLAYFGLLRAARLWPT